MHLHIPAFMGVQPALLTINDDASMAWSGIQAGIARLPKIMFADC
jgi:hypothetical protein